MSQVMSYLSYFFGDLGDVSDFSSYWIEFFLDF